jgi:hypothetical protein
VDRYPRGSFARIGNDDLPAIRDYTEKERPQDNEKWRMPALFLSPFHYIRLRDDFHTFIAM